VFTHIVQWMFFTPEFQVTIVFKSSPLKLLVAPWGMTSKHALHTMKSRKLAMASTSQNTVEMTGEWRGIVRALALSPLHCRYFACTRLISNASC
jgi:hypothetical protein